MSKGFIYATLASFFWAVQIVLAKIILRAGENALNLAFWQVILTVPFWAWLLFKSSRGVKIKNEDLFLILGQVLVGAVGVTIFNSLGIKYSQAVNFAFLVRTTVIFTVVFAYFFLGEKITVKKIILAVIILLGTYLLTTNGTNINLSKGDLYTLAAAACISLGNTVFGKMLTQRFGSYFSSSITFLLAIPIIFSVAILGGGLKMPVWPVMIILVAVIWSLNNFTRFKAYQYASASFIAMIFFFTPVFVSLLAIPLLKESLSLVQGIGGVLIVLSGFVVEKINI